MELLWLFAIVFALSGPAGAVLAIIAVSRLNALSARLDALERRSAAPAAEQTDVPRPEPRSEPAPRPAISQAAAGLRRPAGSGTARARTPLLARLEASLAQSWLVWLGAVTLALGGGFLVKFALDQGWFGPWVRIAAALFAGFAMLGAGDALRRRPGLLGPGGTAGQAAPAALSGAGLVTLYGAVYAAHALYQLVPPPLAFAGLALVAAGALALAWLHGSALALFGLVGAFIAPALIGSDEPNAAGLFAYVFAVSAAGFGAARLLARRTIALVAVAGGLIWPWLWLSLPGGGVLALALYLPLLLAAALLAGQDEAAHDLPAGRVLRDWGLPPAGLLAAWLAAGGTGLIGVLLLHRDGYSEAGLTCLAALALISLFAAWRREGYGPVPLAIAVASVLALCVWPQSERQITDAGEQLAVFMGEAPPPPLRFLPAALGLAGLFGIGGWLALQARSVKAPLAAVSAGAPVLILAAAYLRMNGFEPEPVWALAALGLVLLGSGACARLGARAGGFDAVPGAASAYALGVSAAAAIAAGAASQQMWMSAAFALEALCAAWLWRRFRAPGLPLATLIFGALATVRLIVTGEVFSMPIGPLPILNGLLVGYGVSVLALAGAARLLSHGGLDPRGAAVQSLTAGALVLAIAFVSLQIRHLLTGGALGADVYGVVEMGLHTAAWLFSAAAIRWRLGPHPAFGPRLVEYAAAILAGLQALFFLVLIANPWWGWPEIARPRALFALPVVNVLAMAYALPALAAGCYAVILGRQGARARSRLAGGLGVTLFGLWLLLVVRQAYAGWDGMAAAPVGAAEAYTYSAAGLVYAGLLLAAGVARRRASLRYAGLGLLVAVTVKVFLADMAGLEGFWRGLSFLGLGTALVGLSLFYQRVMPRLAAGRPPA